MQKRLRRNRIIERAGVNAARAFFEENGCTFVEVDLGNDYGKDAYVDVGNGEEVSAICAALQIKAGAKYKTGVGYKIPVDEVDVSMWRESTIPIIGIVFDIDDGKLRWINISDYLSLHANEEMSSIPVSANALLTKDMLIQFSESVRNAARRNKAGPLVQLCDDDHEIQCKGIYDCFVLGRVDYRFFVGMRRLLPTLSIESRRLAINALGHLTPHPDIFWSDSNWIPDTVKQKVYPHLRWTVDDVLAILDAVHLEELDRGRLGLTAFMLLSQDSAIQLVLRDVINHLANEDCDSRSIAISMLIYLAEDDAPTRIKELMTSHPQLVENSLFMALKATVDDYGSIGLF